MGRNIALTKVCPYLDRKCRADCESYSQENLHVALDPFLDPKQKEKSGSIKSVHCFRLLKDITTALRNDYESRICLERLAGEQR